jgi:hypothetical protein
MLARAVGTARESRKLLVGQELRARVRSPESDLTVTVSGGDGPERWEEQVRATPDDEGHEWTFGRTSHSGIYHVDYDAREIPSQLFAVNVDARRESDLDRVSIDDLPSQYQRENILVEEGQQKTNVVIDPSAAPLFRVILGVLLALLLLETFVAWYVGTARA